MISDACTHFGTGFRAAVALERRSAGSSVWQCYLSTDVERSRAAKDHRDERPRIAGLLGELLLGVPEHIEALRESGEHGEDTALAMGARQQARAHHQQVDVAFVRLDTFAVRAKHIDRVGPAARQHEVGCQLQVPLAGNHETW